MITDFFSLILSVIVFGLGCFFVYLSIKDPQKWDAFWERENRNRPLTPNSWAGSRASKLLSYLLPYVLAFGGFLAMFSSVLNLLKYLN